MDSATKSVTSMFTMLSTPPSWAYDFCYYHMAGAFIVVIYSLWTLFSVWSIPGSIKKFVPMMAITFSLILSGTVLFLTTMLDFWVCRASLKHNTTEKFAVKCKSGTDCLAVAGKPQDGDCVCGGRGVCGGCAMRNNQEPSLMDEGSMASITEGFRIQNNGKNNRLPVPAGSSLAGAKKRG